MNFKNTGMTMNLFEQDPNAKQTRENKPVANIHMKKIVTSSTTLSICLTFHTDIFQTHITYNCGLLIAHLQNCHFNSFLILMSLTNLSMRRDAVVLLYFVSEK